MITPLDIENKKFSKQIMNGYSVEEVDEFLDEVVSDYEKNYKELAMMTSKVEELSNSISHYKTIEDTLKNTLVMAQSTAEEVKSVARQQADQIINEANQRAEDISKESRDSARKTLDEIEQQIRIKEQQLDDLKKQFDIYKAKMESLLIAQLELIKDVNKDE